MRYGRVSLIFVAVWLSVGCAPTDRLHFTKVPTWSADWDLVCDTDLDGRPDFALTCDPATGRVDALHYDDDQDGTPDRQYRLADYDPDALPHLVVLVDSIPFRSMAHRLESGPFDALRVLGRPAKVIPPYPSMSALCFSAILQSPPMGGPINRHYDPRPQTNAENNLLRRRLWGYRNPWQQRLHYNIYYRDNAVAFLKPRPWLEVEIARAKRAFDLSGDRVTIVYLSSAAAMLFQYGQAGVDETLDAVQRLVLQVLFERQGAVNITLVSDHGHTLRETQWVDVAKPLTDAGFAIVKRRKDPDDLYLEMDGLMPWLGVHTDRPTKVAEALLASDLPIDTISYLDGFDVVVRNREGQARVSMGDQRRVVYRPGSADVLGYGEALSGKPLDDQAWLSRTADLHYPDAPCRLWQAFHGQTVNVPQVMVTLEDGYCTGIGWLRHTIDLQSTHGGLNQINSAAFVASSTGDLSGPLRSGQVIDAVMPGFVPSVVHTRH